MDNKITRVIGSVGLKSTLSIEEIAEILSELVFGGAKFGGKELKIYDEVPALFINKGVLGLRVILQGYASNEHFHLGLLPDFKLKGIEKYEVDLSTYLLALLKERLKDVSEIQVIDDQEA